jgi:small-conductance mechanosensitive channel
MLERHRALMRRRTSWALRVLILIAWMVVVLNLFALREPLFRALGALLATPLGYGAFQFTLGGVVAFGLTLLFTWLLARAIHFVLDEEIFPRLRLGRGVPFALATLARYAVLLIGFLVALTALGFDLDRITILLGAFGVGIGFGLQTIVNNFVSGLILLFERPVKVGDWVEVAGVEGTVQRIGIRASTVRTFDGADVIVPNGQLLSERVVNWTLSDRRRRVAIRVGVAYGSDLPRVVAVLQGIAGSQSGVCAYPKPVVAFVGFGESSIDFELRVWIDDADLLVETRSGLGLSMEAALREAGIEIPFPQRVLRVGSVAPEAAAALRATAPER